ncbi:MAG: O-antigen ligase family protein, partial [Arenicellales bacterium]
MLLIYAPLFRASNIPLALMFLQMMSLALLVLVVFGNEAFTAIKKPQLILIALILAVPLVSLLPFPEVPWGTLPGRDIYMPVLQGVAGADNDFMKSISLAGNATEYALWTLLPPLIVYIAAVNLPRHHLYTLVYVVLGIAVFQAILGLMQYGAGPKSPLHFGTPGSNTASGTWLNRDHYAGFLEMVFPVALALLAATIGINRKRNRQKSNWRKKLAFMSTVKGNQAAIYAFILVLMILALIFTKSRAGVGLAMVGLFISMFVFANRLGGSNVYGSVGTIIAVIVILAIEIGLAPVLDRFSVDPMEDLRLTIYSSSMEGIGSFFPIGSGAGTFPISYPFFQPVDLDAFINRAHNDYLEWIYDGGMLSIIAIGMFFVLYINGWRRLWIPQRWGTFRFIQAGAGIGIFLIILHSAIDFNLHKPANAVFFAF